MESSSLPLADLDLSEIGGNKVARDRFGSDMRLE